MFTNTMLATFFYHYQIYQMEFTKENIKLICADNMKIMAQYPDNYFDLAVLDPEYGIGEDGHCRTRKKHNNKVKHKKKDWDNKRPENIFFIEIQRISKNQIIWGGNYFADLLPPKMGWIFWNKKIGGDFSDGELAWTSFDKALKMFTKWNGFNGIARIHPTQKPVVLYNFCFDYAKAQKDWKIIDTNFGSGSSAISAYYFGFAEYVGIDIDSDYFNDAVKRFKAETMQQRLF